MQRTIVIAASTPCVAGQRVDIEQSLEHGLVAFRPASFKVDNAEDWAIVDFTIYDTPQLRCSQCLATHINQYLREGGCYTIQTRMGYSMSAVYQGRGNATFRCEMTGEAV